MARQLRIVTKQVQLYSLELAVLLVGYVRTAFHEARLSRAQGDDRYLEREASGIVVVAPA